MTDIDILEELVADEHYLQLANLRPEFNLFEVLGTHLSENATSRAIAYLCDSRESHGLGTALFDAWMQQIHSIGMQHRSESSGPGRRMSLDCLLRLRGNRTMSIVEWVTRSNRRIDILIKVADHDLKTIAVVAVENKHWAIDQPKQIEDYRSELDSQFSSIERALIYLTPDGKDAPLESSGEGCDYISSSYDPLIGALQLVKPSTKGPVQILVDSLATYLDKAIQGNDPMSDKAAEVVRQLYQDEHHRKAIKLILRHAPTWGNLTDEIVNRFKKKWPTDQFEATFYQRRHQVYLTTKELDKGSYKLYYQLEADSDADIGGEVRIRILAEPQAGASPHESIVDSVKDVTQQIKDLLAGPEFGTISLLIASPSPDGKPKNWFRTFVIAEGTISLRDLGEEDANVCANALDELVKCTIETLKRFP